MKTIPFDNFGIMLDCSRNAVINMTAFRRLTDVLSSLGCNSIMLYTEDTYEVEGEPYFGYMRGRFSIAEIREMDAYAKSKNIELIPCIQTLAHLGSIFRYPGYAGIRDVDDILLVGDPKTYELIDRMFASVAKAFSSRKINIGMDEAFALGHGRFLDKNGIVPRAEIMSRHLEKVLAIAGKYGFDCRMWSDMFATSAYGGFYEHTKDDSDKVRPLVPKNLSLIYWDYYHTEQSFYEDMIDKHKKLSDNVVFAGGAWTWTGFCPNNTYSIESMGAAVKACVKKGIRDVFFTMWGDNGGECSPFGVLPTLVTLSEYAKGNYDRAEIEKVFKKIVGADFNAFMLLERPDRICSVPGKPDTHNPSKTMLYTDPFCGLFDKCIAPGLSERYYTDLSEQLKKQEKNDLYGYLFKTIRTLCDVLAVKFDLGVRTRELYRGKDKAALKELALKDYTDLCARLEEFYAAFETCWATEKKPYGFDVQDARFGGLIRRIAHLKKRLLDYADGKVPDIPELEEELLYPLGGGKDSPVSLNCYNMLYTANVT